METYTLCMNCNNQSSIKLEFLDVQLPVRNGDNVDLTNIEEAITNFLTPEDLTGNNMYHCSKCDKKCDAKKGVKFLKLPYIVNFFLVRMAYNKVTKILDKLNHRSV